MKTGEFSSQWFKRAMADCCKEGSCNFTIIGGVFVLLGNAEYLSAAGTRGGIVAKIHDARIVPPGGKWPVAQSPRPAAWVPE